MFIRSTTLTVSICLQSDLSEKYIKLHYSSALSPLILFHHTENKTHTFTVVHSLVRLTSGYSDLVSYLLS